jgi:hypothetical protein
MATKRAKTIGSNPLKPSKAKTVEIEQTATPPIVEAEGLVSQSPEVKKRVRRTNKETEALFAEQLKADAPSAAAKDRKAARNGLTIQEFPLGAQRPPD